MSHLTPINAKKLEKILKKLGFQFVRQKGSHAPVSSIVPFRGCGVKVLHVVSGVAFRLHSPAVAGTMEPTQRILA